MRVCLCVVLAAVLLPPPTSAQHAGSTFLDPEARRLVEGVQSLRRTLGEEGLPPVVLTNRMRVGFLLPKQWNWRDPTLFHKESLGGAAYDASGGRVQAVLARARGAPVIGDRLIDRPALWNYFGFDPEETRPALFGLIGLSLAGISQDLPSASSPSVHQVFDSLFVDPLGPLGPKTYVYSSGPPLALGREDPTTLLAVEFRPSDPGAGPLTGILWFDAETNLHVRAMIRPHGRWPLNAGLRGLIRSLPLIPRDATGGMDYLTVDYQGEGAGLSWPAVARVQGAMYWFWDQAVLPVQIEWEADWGSDAPSQAEERAPPPLFGAWSFSVDRQTLNPFIRELDRVVGPPPAPSLRQTLTRALTSGRFNQAQGVNFKIQYPFPVGARTVVNAEVGIPTTAFRFTGAAGLRQEVYPYGWGVEVYSRLRDANWMESVNGFTASLTALLTGYDDGIYYLAQGADLWFSYGDRPLDGGLSVFAERHRSAPKTATYSLFEPDTLPSTSSDVEVDTGDFFGVRGRVDLQLGDDVQKGVLVVRLHGQAATGDRVFASLGTTTDLVGPLPGPLSGGLRVQMGIAAGDPPAQALYYLGGHKTIRGYPANTVSGESVLILSGEIGTSTPLARVVTFIDAGWANEQGHLFDEEALTAVGIGLSFADGTLRADLAKGLDTGGVWRLHVATSGLF